MAGTIEHKIPFAIRSNGSVASIREVGNGLACGCTCPACGARLVARQGPIQAWHFAHESEGSCGGALESSLHAAVKQIIEQERRLLLPSCNVTRYPTEHLSLLREAQTSAQVSPPYSYLGGLPEWHRRLGVGEGSLGGGLVRFADVIVERNEGDIRPDLIGITDTGRRLYIEVAVTHFVNIEKLDRIRARRTATIELVFEPGQSSLTWEQLTEHVVSKTAGKRWIFNPRAETMADSDFQRKEGYRRQLGQEQKEAAERLQRRLRNERKKEEELDRAKALAEREQAARLAAEQARIKLEAQRRAEEWEKGRPQREAEAARATERLRKKREDEAAAAQAERERMREETRAAAEELARRHRHLSDALPSPDEPLAWPVLFLDMDRVLRQGEPGFADRLGMLAQALNGVLCSIIVTSECRLSRTTQELAGALASLGGRHVGVTPVLDPTDPYGNRKNEISAWLQAAGEPQGFMLLETSSRGFPSDWRTHVISPRAGWSEEDVAAIRRRCRCL